MRKFWPLLVILLLTTCQPATATARPRLLVMGDSLTVGLFATSEQAAFKHHLAEMLSADLGSCYGPQLAQVVDCWERYQAWQPNIVVIEVGLNDVSSPQSTDSAWTAVYADLVANIQATGATVVITTMFHGVASSNQSYATYEHYNGHIASLADESGAILADVWAATRDCANCISQPGTPSPFAPYWEGDNFHPSDAGHLLIAETIYQSLQRQATYLPLVRTQ
jgi:acyl-CoA thioesterase-1